jgi:hypothetical protein
LAPKEKSPPVDAAACVPGAAAFELAAAAGCELPNPPKRPPLDVAGAAGAPTWACGCDAGVPKEKPPEAGLFCCCCCAGVCPNEKPDVPLELAAGCDAAGVPNENAMAACDRASKTAREQ